MGDFAEGKNFPWKPLPISELVGSSFVNNKGETFGKDALEGKYLGIYFSAHWCPPCRKFTPVLAKMHETLKAAGKPFEIIFASSDKSADQFNEYMAEMPWLALPYADRAKKEGLSKKFDVSGIPHFVILDDTPERNIVNSNARNAVMADSEGAKFPWSPPPVKILPDGVDELNGSTCVIVFVEGCDDDEQEETIAAMEIVAKEFAAAKDELVFMVAKDSDTMSSQIRKLTKLKPGPTAQLLMLDIPDDGGYHYPSETITSVTAESLRKFIADYKGKKTERKQME